MSLPIAFAILQPRALAISTVSKVPHQPSIHLYLENVFFLIFHNSDSSLLSFLMLLYSTQLLVCRAIVNDFSTMVSLSGSQGLFWVFLVASRISGFSHPFLFI